MRSAWEAWRLTVKLVTSQRKLFVPFVIAALVETLFVGMLWLAPHPPFSRVLAPPIRYFFGDRVLHYPVHLWFLYHAMKHTNLFTSILVGAFMSGIACAMVRQVHEQTPLSLRDALVAREVPYARVTLLWLITWGLAKGTLELASKFIFIPKTIWALVGVIGLTVVLQALLVYAIPAAVFDDAKWWKALWRGLREACRHPLSTLIMVLIPSAMVIGFAIFLSPAHLAQWMVHTAPEIAIPLVAARLFVWTVADAILTISISHLWWIHRASRRAVKEVNVTIASAIIPRERVLQEGPAVA